MLDSLHLVDSVYFTHSKRHQKDDSHLSSAYYHDSPFQTGFIGAVLKDNPSVSAALSGPVFVLNLGLIALVGAVEATRVAGELSAVLRKKKAVSHPHSFVLLPKDVDGMRLNAAWTTMKQRGNTQLMMLFQDVALKKKKEQTPLHLVLASDSHEKWIREVTLAAVRYSEGIFSYFCWTGLNLFVGFGWKQ